MSETQEALTIAERLLSFEGSFGGAGSVDWRGTAGAATRSTQHSDLDYSMALAGNWNPAAIGASLPALGTLSGAPTIDVLLPQGYANQGSYWGQIALSFTCASANIFGLYHGPVALTGPTGSFGRYTLPALPSNLRTALQSGGCVVTVQANLSNSGAQGILVDRLFLGQSSGGGTGGTGGTGGSSGSSGSAGAGGVAAGGGTAGTSGAGGSTGGAGAGGSSAGTGGGGGGGAGGAAQTLDFFIELPSGIDRRDIALGTHDGGSLTIDDGVDIVEESGAFAAVSSVRGANRTELGVGVDVGSLWSQTNVFLRNVATVHGDLTTQGTVESQGFPNVLGTTRQLTSLETVQHLAWPVVFPGTNQGPVNLEPGETRTISPGAFAGVNLKTGARLTLTGPGRFTFAGAFFMEPSSVLDVRNAGGAVEVYARDGLTFRGAIAKEQARANLLIGVGGSSEVPIERALDAILVAPWARVSMSSLSGETTHRGSVFAKAIIHHQHTRLVHDPFDPAEFCAATAPCSAFCPCSDGEGTCASEADCEPLPLCVNGTCQCGTECAGKECGDNPVDSCGRVCPGICDDGDPGCSNDRECPVGSTCATGVGEQFGLPADTNVCWPIHCNEIDPTQPGCGVDDDPHCGACPVCVPRCDGRSCGSDGCGDSCGGCPSGNACTPEGQCIQAFTPGDFYPTGGHPETFPLPLPEDDTTAVGAVHGSFSVSNRGAATYSIPIRVPPARAGFEPDLALVYTGSKHEGLMGQGWRVSGFSAISRCPSGGRPTSYTGPGFCLDGSHLVELDGQVDPSDREYRTEVDSFSKIIGRGFVFIPGDNNTNRVEGPEYFEVLTKDGRRLIYGQNDNASLFSHNAKRVWALESVHDQAGNTILFEYQVHTVRHDLAGEPQGDDGDLVDTGELIPKAVTYNGHESGFEGDVWVSFSYEDRPDPQYHFVDGARGFSLRRLTSVTTFVGDNPARSYLIGYPTGENSIVTSITECADDGGDATKCIPATTFSYKSLLPYQDVNSDWLGLSDSGNDEVVSALDQDGDGYSDVVVRQQSGGSVSFKVVRSRVQPDGTFTGDSINLPWTSQFAPGLISDVNRDGLDDIVDPGGAVFVSGAASFTRLTFARPSGTVLTPVIADVDGDGLRDLVTSQSRLGVAFFHAIGDRIADGVMFRPPDVPDNCDRLVPIDIDGDQAEEVLCIPARGGQIIAVGASRSIEGLIPRTHSTGIWLDIAGNSNVTVMDFNGDGLRDVLEKRGGDLILWENSGDGFRDRTLTVVLEGGPEQIMPGRPSEGTVLDFNGDGRDDFLISTTTGTLVFIPTGRQELTRFDAQLGVFGTALEPPLVGDLNGDGNPDLIGHGKATIPDVALGLAARRGLLDRVTDGLGARIDIEYEPRTAISGLSQPVRTYRPRTCNADDPSDIACLSQMPPLVSEYEEFDTVANQRARRFVLAYDGAKTGLGGRGFYGFGSRQIILLDDADQISGTTELLFYNEDQPRAGMLLGSSVHTAAAPETTMSRESFSQTITSNFVEIGISAAGQRFPKAIGGQARFIDVFPGLASEEVRRRDWTTAVDNFGDVESETTRETVGSTMVEETTRSVVYPSSSDTWRVSLPSDVTITNRRSGELLERKIHYDYYASGLLENVIRDSADPDIYLKVSLARDAFGNVDGITSTPLSPSETLPERHESIVYDDRGTFPLRITNAEDQTTEIDLDPETGQPRVVGDPNNIFVRWAYDGLGRQTEVRSPDNAVTTEYRTATPFESLLVGVISPAMEVVQTPGGGGAQTTAIDAFGRTVSTATVGFLGAIVSQEFVYDWRHRLLKETLPHIASDTSQGLTSYDYDPAGRLRTVTAADGSFATYLYATRKTVKTEFIPWFTLSAAPEASHLTAVVKPRGNVEARVLDHVGSPVASIEAAGTDAASRISAHFTSMKYGAFRGLRLTRDQNGNLTTLTPDTWGRVIAVDDPDSGEERRELSPWGELTSVTDGNDETRDISRDKLGRIRKLLRPGGELIAEWVYDGPGERNEIGRLISAYRQSRPGSDIGNTLEYRYEDAAGGVSNTGRLARITRTIQAEGAPSKSFATTLGYDQFGRIEAVGYPASPGATSDADPDPFEVVHAYDDDSGLLTAVQGSGTIYWQMLAADQGFRLSKELFGNGVESRRDYYSLDDPVPECTMGTEFSCLPGLVRTITTDKTEPGDIQELSYQYDSNANLRKRVIGGGSLTESFAYDGFDQVISHVSTFSGGATLARSFTYDELGNLKSRTGVGTYTYAGSGRPHAVHSVGSTEYTYDDNGSQLTRDGDLVAGGFQKLDYNDFQMPWRVTTGTGGAAFTTDIEYDAFERRIAKRSEDETTHYVGDLYEHVAKAGEVEHRYKIFAGSQQVAQVVRTEVGEVVTTTATTYIHDDHLGSASAITSQAGTILDARQFGPFGDTTTNFADADVRAGFTGHQHDGELGLINMRGRLYDPTLGQFVQADPLVTTLNPRGLNRYAYVMNNPLMNTDPSGFAKIFGFTVPFGPGNEENSTLLDSDGDGIPDKQEAEQGGIDIPMHPALVAEDYFESSGPDMGAFDASQSTTSPVGQGSDPPGMPPLPTDAGPLDLTGNPPMVGGISAQAPIGGTAPDPGMGASLGMNGTGPSGRGLAGYWSPVNNASGSSFGGAGNFLGTAPVAVAAGGVGPLILPAAAIVAAGVLIWKAIEKSQEEKAEAAEQAKQFKNELLNKARETANKAGRSGDAAGAAANVAVGAELIREANRQPKGAYQDALKKLGRQLIERGRADRHPGGRR